MASNNLCSILTRIKSADSPKRKYLITMQFATSTFTIMFNMYKKHSIIPNISLDHFGVGTTGIIKLNKFGVQNVKQQNQMMTAITTTAWILNWFNMQCCLEHNPKNKWIIKIHKLLKSDSNIDIRTIWLTLCMTADYNKSIPIDNGVMLSYIFLFYNKFLEILT